MYFFGRIVQNGDTSMTFGRNVPLGSLSKKKSASHVDFQHGGHFFQDGRQGVKKKLLTI